MKNFKNKWFVACALLLMFYSTNSISQHLQVAGNVLQDSLGNDIILRGVNYPIIDDYGVPLDNHALVEARIDQLALTGANCVRLPWYTNGTHYKDNLNPAVHTNYGPNTLDGYVNDGHLSHLLQYCFSKGMIPVLEIHNFTGSSDFTAFQNTVIPFWTSPAMLAVIEENKDYLIINLANEFGFANYAPDPLVGLYNFKVNYITSVQQIRAAGIEVPIMLDAPDYGQSSSEFLSIAPDIFLTDTKANILFSIHAYWAVYANTIAQITTKINEMANASVLAFVFGEIANTQADAPTYCGELDISGIYPEVLTQACDKNIGWLAWSWDQDCDSSREMSNNATFSNLTPYGDDIVNNPNYGLKSTTGCGAEEIYPSTSGVDALNKNQIQCYPNPTNGSFVLKNNSGSVLVNVIDMQGKVISSQEVIGEMPISIDGLQKGVYFLELFGRNENQRLRILIK